MLAELRQRSQITIPKELIKKLNLNEGDKFDVYEQDGIIHLMPVAVYPKKYVEDLRKEIEATKEKIKSGKRPMFDSVDELFSKLEEE